MSLNKYHDDDLDDELDDLDDYLDEFQEEILNQPSSLQTTPAHKEPTPTQSNSNDTEDELQLQDQLRQMMEAMEKEQPGASSRLQNLLDEVAKMDGLANGDVSEQPSPDSKSKDFKSTVADTLNRVKQSGGKVDQSIKDESADPTKLMEELFSKLNMEDDNGLDGGDMDFSSLLTDMLDQLVTKKILYAPLKDMDIKYPQWLIDNRTEISEQQYQKYHKQSLIVHEIVLKFEEDTYREDSKPHKEFISQKLEEMEEQGEPPKEIGGDLSKTGFPGFQFGSDSVDPTAFDGMEMPEGFNKELEENCKTQ